MPLFPRLRLYTTLSLSTLFLSGCAAPPAFQVISLALDGISYLTTEKSVADHGLSLVAQEDCKMLRSLKGEDICQKEPEDIEELEVVIEKTMTDSEKQSALTE
jgi:hypothetical protein